MRDSNFAFPAQNKACVLITSTLYDRRALDTTSPLPLLNSLTHLTYLTSTSPRIREILTCDGGLERLVRLLRDFCIAPPPPDNPSLIFGLSPPAAPRPPLIPTLNPKLFDRHAAFRFSLAFQCVVNIGVRGSESIRRRVVEAGTLDVVGCVLESWLLSKGFAVIPSSSASGLPRESREQRSQRRQQLLEQRQREQAQQLARRLAEEHHYSNSDARESVVEDENMSRDQSVSNSDAETSVSTDTSANATPQGSGTPTGSVVVPGRDRSGTLVGRTVWDEQPVRTESNNRRHQARTMSRSRTVRAHGGHQLDLPMDSTPSTSTSRPDTETEDDAEPDADVEMDLAESHDQENLPRHQHRQTLHINTHPRRTVGIVADSPSPTAAAGVRGTLGSESLDVVDLDAHIIINTDALGDDAVRDAGGLMAAGVDEGIVALDQNVNDDLALGAPPGAPGAIDATPRTRNRGLTVSTGGRTTATGREEMTPRAALSALPAHAPPMPIPVSLPVAAVGGGHTGENVPQATTSRATATGTQELRIPTSDGSPQYNNTLVAATTRTAIAPQPPIVRHPHHHRHHYHHHHTEDSGPFREDEVLLSLQLLAYLSKYPHVRQAFYKPRASFHPATVALYGGVPSEEMNSTSTQGNLATTNPSAPPSESKETSFFNFKTMTGRRKDTTTLFSTSGSTWSSTSASPGDSAPSKGISDQQQQQRITNVFSLVERFTFRPSPTESNLANPPPFLPPEIQYWAGVIMRNACRKDESRGGIRQCANMLCGKWENFPREFAKCRRCRKAKYCGKECQSRAWSEGHRFWCSVREEGDNLDGLPTTDVAHRHQNQQLGLNEGHAGEPQITNNTRTAQLNTALLARVQRREERERARQQMVAAAAAAMASIPPDRLANAIRQRTQAANVNPGPTNSMAISVGSRDADDSQRERGRRREDNFESNAGSRGRAYATDGEFPSSSVTRNGDSNYTEGDARIQSSGDRRGLHVESTTRAQIQSTMARMYRLNAGGAAITHASTSRNNINNTPNDHGFINSASASDLSVDFIPVTQQQRPNHQTMDLDDFLADAPGRPRTGTLPLPIALPALQQNQRGTQSRHDNQHEIQTPQSIDEDPLHFSPYGINRSDTRMGADRDNMGLRMDASFPVVDDNDANMVDREDSLGADNIEIVDLDQSSGNDVSFAVLGEDGSLTPANRNEDTDQMVLG